PLNVAERLRSLAVRVAGPHDLSGFVRGGRAGHVHDVPHAHGAGVAYHRLPRRAARDVGSLHAPPPPLSRCRSAGSSVANEKRNPACPARAGRTRWPVSRTSSAATP